MCRKGSGKSASNRQILAGNVRPSHYKLTLLPSVESPHYSGQVSISMTVLEATKSIMLNANEIVVTSASVVGFRLPEGEEHRVTWSFEPSALNLPKQEANAITYQKEEETVTMTFTHEIPATSKIVLHLEFEGIHNDKMNGFYRSSYLDEHGNQKYLLCTQFEPSDARKAFPCADEPNLKATFDVTLHVPLGLVGLSNMNVVNQDQVEIGGKCYTSLTFATTPIMSTYLLAFCVGDFEYLEETAYPIAPADAKPIVCRTYTLRGQKHLGRFALETSVKVLEYFSAYFDYAYPLPKLDQIAIPDFSAGAMENWGLITYRENYLLYEEGSYSAQALEDVADTVAHELAHQWFGNLVTMDWWDELWLNEGFATFVGTMAVNHLFPKWDHFTGFLQTYVSKGLEHDSLISSHPIHVDVSSPADVEQIFDAISYNKGASVIRMLEDFLSREAFSKGVNLYLKEFAYKNATTKDLWKALSTASSINVEMVMNTWVEKVGYPVITVVKEDYDEEKKVMNLTLKQERFLSFKSVSLSDSSLDSSVWFVPVTVLTDSFPVATRHLEAKEGVISFPYTPSEKSFYKLNANGIGFYRIGYSSLQMNRILQTLAGQQSCLFSVQDRLQLINDAFACAKAGVAETSTALQLLDSFKNESSGIVLATISFWLSAVEETFALDENIRNGIKTLTRNIFASLVSTVGFDYSKNEDYLMLKKRTTIIKAAANANDPRTLEELEGRFNLYAAGEKESIDPNLFHLVFTTVLRTSTEPKRDFYLVFDIYRKSSNLSEKIGALRSLAAVADRQVLDKLMNETIMDTCLVKTQDTEDALYGLYYSPLSITQVFELKWNWWIDKFDDLTEMMEAKNLPIDTLLESFVGEEHALRVEQWLKDGNHLKKLESVQRELENGIENIRIRTAWFERDRESMQKWLLKMK